MNQRYSEDVHLVLQDLGFCHDLHLIERLENEIKTASPQFTLNTDVGFDDSSTLLCELYFRTLGPLSKIALYKYLARLRYTHRAENDKQQMFEISMGSALSARQAFNLLEGRSVLAKKVGYENIGNAWMRIDFNRVDENGYYRFKQTRLDEGYDLEKTLLLYPIREMNDSQERLQLLESLKKGNLQPVMFDKRRKSERMYIEANPEFKTINIYPNGNPIRKLIES